MVLNNSRARAEVIETYRPYKGEIRIRVAGIQTKELLSIVANEIDEINASFEKIKVAKKIPCICEECRDDPEPHFFRLETLDRYLAKRRYKIVCEKSLLDVPVRNLIAVMEQPDQFPDLEDKQAEQREFDRLKKLHTELYPPSQSPPVEIHADNVQTVESTAGGDAVIHKHVNEPPTPTNHD